MSNEDVSEALGRYLETVFYLEGEGERARASRIADWLGVSQPTVASAVRRLSQAGLVTLSPSKEVTFTPAGRERAARIVRTHRIVERWLTDEMGLDWVQADLEAGRLQHGFSDAVVERLHERLGRPLTCPHGNVIPGEPEEVRPERPLTDLRPGEHSTMLRVSEVTEHDAPALLQFLADRGFALGVHLEVVSSDPSAGVLTVRLDGQSVAMSLDTAEKLRVE